MPRNRPYVTRTLPMRTALLAWLLAACSAPAARPESRAPEAPAAQAPASPADTLPARPPAQTSPWVERTLAGMTLRQKAGQMIVVWTSGAAAGPGDPAFDRIARWVAADAAGAVIISIGSPRAYAEKLNGFQRRARIPLLVVTDMESGPGMRLTGEATDFPPAMGLAATGSDSLAFEVGRVIGREGRAVGLGMTLAPVLDVNSDPRNPIINTRSYGEDPADVARIAAVYLRGVQAGGLLAAGKHFPGHGDTHLDSHIELATVEGDRARLAAVELPPFRAAVEAGIDGMLVGHLAVPSVEGDGIPGSLSRRVTTGLLREELGFRGLVFTDALNMGGVTRRFSQAEAVVLGIEAGADFLLQPADAVAAVNAIVAAVEAGRISEARIDTSVRRILAAKERAGVIAAPMVDVAAMERVVGAAEHRRLAAEVARRSITLVRDARNLVPLSGGRKTILSVTYTDGNRPSAGRAFDAALRTAGHTVTSERVGDATTAAAFAALRRRAASADLVVVSGYVSPREYRGSVQTGGGFPAFVQGLAADGVPVVAVSFGSPYLLTSFPAVPAYLVAWGGAAQSQTAAAEALLGRAPITGRMPVSLPQLHPRGAGLTRGAGAQAGQR